MGLTILVTANDKAVNATAQYIGPGDISKYYWNMGDGFTDNGTSLTSISHTYANYGTYTISLRCPLWINNGGSNITASYQITLKDPSIDEDLEAQRGSTTFDVFGSKPIVIPAECTGDVSITASIKETDEPDYVSKDEMSNEITAYVNITGVSLGANGEATFVLDRSGSTLSTGEVSDSSLINLGNIPAFYNSGYVTIEYNLDETSDEDSNFDLKWDLKMCIQDLPEWAEGNYTVDSQIFKNMISSDQSEVNFPSATSGTTATQVFTIGSFSQLPPFEIRDFIDEPATNTVIKRAMLANPQFTVVLTNMLSSEISLSRVTCKFRFSFNPMDIFMNMRTEGGRRKKQARLYTLPKGAEVKRYSNMGFPVYAVLDGYLVGTSERPPEVVKVYGTWNEFHDDGEDGFYFPTTIQLYPVDGMDGPDYPTCLYKSSINPYPMKGVDFIRVTDGNWMNNDGVIVIDAPKIAASEKYRVIDVRVEGDKSPDDQMAAFVITTTENQGTDDFVTIDEICDNVDKIHFFNYVCDFATQVKVNRSSIDPMFYETLWQTYDKAPVLESIVEEPLYYINFTINDYPKMIPIYDGQTLKFSDSLQHAADGVRSGDIFYFDGKTPNVINMQNPTKHKYKVKFQYDYEVYKDVYILTDEDLPVKYRSG